MALRTFRIFAACLFGAGLAASQTSPASGDDVVFRSEVSLVRVDAHVLDGNRAITGLTANDFVLRENGRRREIRNFASENMPVDVLLLLDVSASMEPHVQRIASAAHEAFSVLTDKDRVAIMVFDRSTRVRLPFRDRRDEVERGLNDVLRMERFNGGTDITRGMVDAAEYMARNGRKDARHAIVILTDDETQMERNDERVARALERADAILCALIAPDAMAGRNGGYPGGMGRRGGMGGGGLGGIILPGGGIPGIGGRMPPGVSSGGGRTHSAGTSEIARDSGGDSLPVDDASALETTLDRIRRRYSLYFQLPPGAQKGQDRRVEISLSADAMRRNPNAEVRFRHSYIAPSDGPAGPDNTPEPVTVSGMTETPSRGRQAQASDSADAPIPSKRRAAVSGPGSSSGPLLIPDKPQP